MAMMTIPVRIQHESGQWMFQSTVNKDDDFQVETGAKFQHKQRSQWLITYLSHTNDGQLVRIQTAAEQYLFPSTDYDGDEEIVETGDGARRYNHSKRAEWIMRELPDKGLHWYSFQNRVNGKWLFESVTKSGEENIVETGDQVRYNHQARSCWHVTAIDS